LGLGWFGLVGMKGRKKDQLRIAIVLLFCLNGAFLLHVLFRAFVYFFFHNFCSKYESQTYLLSKEIFSLF